MKFLSTVNKVHYLEDAECELLKGVQCYTNGKVVDDAWGNGWIYETDEYFPTFCVIKYGFEPIVITDDEYLQLLSDGMTWVDRSRSKQVHATLAAMRVNR